MDRSIPWWLRAIFVFVAVQAFLFLPIFFRPDLITELEPWKATPLNARFIASLYLATGIGVLLCSMGKSYHQVRIVLIGIGFATGMLFLLTVFRLYFYPGEVAQFPLKWLAFYFVDPLLVVFTVWRLRTPARTGATMQNRLAPLWIVQTALLSFVGLLMMVFPGLVLLFWPWSATDALIQLYGAFFLALALITGLAIREPRWDGVRSAAIMLVTLGIAVVFISILHHDRFTSLISTIVWLLLFSIEALLFGGLVLRHPTHLQGELI